MRFGTNQIFIFMNSHKFLCLFLFCFWSCQGQKNKTSPSNSQQPKQETNSIVGGGCEGCELMYVDMPKNINAIDTSMGWHASNAQKLLITGKVFELDGITPAPNVVLYYWHTDINGYYSNGNGTAKRHGKLRGWVKTDKQGNYAIYTNRPTAYPDNSEPQHIHIAIKEPDIQQEYYIDDLVFDDDPILYQKNKAGRKYENRGGSSVLRVLMSQDVQIAEHNIILGLHIPNYPKKTKQTINSGLSVGEDSPSFIPFHAWGTDKDTRVCPVCKYGRYWGILLFVGDNPDWQDIRKWLVFLEKESEKKGKELKVYFVYGNSKNYNAQNRRKELETLGNELKINNLALTFVPSMQDTESEVHLNKINPEVKNTFVIYRHRKILQKFINFDATQENFQILSDFLEKNKSPYNHLSDIKH